MNLNPGFAGHALNFALYAHQPEIARLLIERGADLTVRSPGGEHQTPPIVWAAYNQQGDASVARLMIEKGADVNTPTALGETALDWARARNNRSLVALLEASGAKAGTRSPKGKAIPDRELPENQDGLGSLIRSSAGRAIGLLHQTSDVFLESSVVRNQKCVTCHQQTLPAIAFAWARERGIPVDEPSIARQVQDQKRYWSKDQKIARTYEMTAPQPDTVVLVGYGLSGLSALGYPADALTEAMVWYLAATQCPDGSWPARDFRPPMEDGPIQGTAFGIRALRLYPIVGRETEFGRRIDRARDYLARAQPETFNQRVFQLLGLGWAGDSAQALRPFVQAIVEKQGDDGGWSQLDGLPPDAWATGAALVALHTAGGVPTTDPPINGGSASSCAPSLRTARGMSEAGRGPFSRISRAGSPTARTSGSPPAARRGPSWPCCSPSPGWRRRPWTGWRSGCPGGTPGLPRNPPPPGRPSRGRGRSTSSGTSNPCWNAPVSDATTATSRRAGFTSTHPSTC